MKLLILALAISTAYAMNTKLTAEWEEFKKTHQKEYSTSLEELTRFQIWQANSDYITKHNLAADDGHFTFWLKMNKFGDMTTKEFAQYNRFNASLKIDGIYPNGVFLSDPSVVLPDTVDWRTQGYVTPVKDQGQCGSCWAFSTTGSLEGQHFKQTGKLVSLSEQNLVDCSTKYGNQGCNGGLMDQAFSYIKDNKGIDTESSYPYNAVDQKCQFSPDNVGATDTGFIDVESKNEQALQQAVATVGPISVAIDASHTNFQFYSHGVYYEILCSETRLDHGVLAVGYGTDGKNDYWLVKNSWGEVWGDKGYIKMSRNRKNNCGIATAASYPTV
jgi:cathepsin L